MTGTPASGAGVVIVERGGPGICPPGPPLARGDHVASRALVRAADRTQAEPAQTPTECLCEHPRLDSLNHCRTCGLPDAAVIRNQVLSRAAHVAEAESARARRQ